MAATTKLGLLLVIGGIGLLVVLGLAAVWYYRDKK